MGKYISLSLSKLRVALATGGGCVREKKGLITDSDLTRPQWRCSRSQKEVKGQL